MLIRSRDLDPPGTVPGQSADAGGPAASLTVVGRPSGEGVIISLIGELDIATADGAITRVGELTDRYRGPVLLDLNCLFFCDARGLGALLLMRRHARQLGQQLHIAAPSQQVARIIAIAGLTGELPAFQCVHTDCADGYPV
jgi:anti-sigma B factor antagonist